MPHEQEKDKLLNAYYQDQTIAPDGKLRPTFSRLVERADKAEAELSRLTARIEDRQQLADVIGQAVMDKNVCLFVADRLIAYLKPLG